MGIMAPSQNVILTKAHSMFGKRLTLNDYKELIKKNSISEITTYLKNNTKYKKSLKNIDEINIHRGQLELIIRKNLFNRYTALCRYQISKKNKFYYYYILKLEVEQILRCIMLLNTNSMDEFIIELPGFLISKASFDMLSLAKVRSFVDLAEVLKNSSYKDIINRCIKTDSNKVDYTSCEILLRNDQYKKIFEIIDKSFKGKEKKLIRSAFEFEINLLNLSSIVRLKKYFKLSPEEISKKLISFKKFFREKKIKNLLSSELDKDFIDLCNSIFKDAILTQEHGNFIEHYTHKLKYKYNKRLLYFSTFASCTFYSFFILEEIEIENLINIIEGIRYNVNPSEIEKLIII